MKKRVLLFLSLIFISVAAHALTIGLRCLHQGNDAIRKYLAEQAQSHAHTRQYLALDMFKSSKLYLNNTMSVLTCMKLYVERPEITTDCSGLPPPNIHTPLANHSPPRIEKCFEIFDDALDDCKKTHPKDKNGYRLCIKKAEKQSAQCAKKNIKHTKMITPPVERPLFDMKPLWYSKGKMDMGSEIWVCDRDKKGIVRWFAGKLIIDGFPNHTVRIKSQNQKKKISRAQVISRYFVEPTYPTTNQKHQYQIMAKIDEVLYLTLPTIVALAHGKKPPAKPNYRGLATLTRQQDKKVWLTFNPKQVEGRLQLKLTAYLDKDNEANYRCDIIGQQTVIAVPTFCQGKKKKRNPNSDKDKGNES